MSVIAFLLMTLPVMSQPNDMELADPKPGPQEAWNALKKITLGWGTIDQRYSRSQVPVTSAKTLTLRAWKGERVAAQAVLATPIELQNVSMTVSDLKCGKSVIPASNVKKYFVRYVMTDWHNDKKDSFLLADRLDPAKALKVAAKTTRPLWLDLKVPADVKAGTYKGVLSVDCDGQKLTLPLQVQVVNHVLPEPKDWKFHLDLWQNPYAFARYYQVPLWSQAHFDLMRPLMQLLANAGEKVITASIIQHPWNSQTYDPFESMIAKMKQLDGSWKYDYTVFDKWIQFMMDCGITEQIDCYTLVPWSYIFDYYDCATNSVKTIACQPSTREYRDLILPFLKDFAQHLKQKGWFDRTCIAMDERPMDQMDAAWKVVKEADPNWRIEGAANYDVDSEIGDRVYDLSVAYQYKLLSKDVLDRRNSKGQKITFYTCCGPDRPNTFTFSDPAESAFLGWHAMAAGYNGYLRWAYCSWTPQPNQDSRFITWPSGDCYLVYPGCSSIRMERLVEGIQDYEKIRILKETSTEAQLKKLDAILEKFRPNTFDESQKAEDLLKAGKDFLFSF